MQYGLEDTFLELSLVDGRKLELEQERPEALDGGGVLAVVCKDLRSMDGVAMAPPTALGPVKK